MEGEEKKLGQQLTVYTLNLVNKRNAWQVKNNCPVVGIS